MNREIYFIVLFIACLLLPSAVQAAMRVEVDLSTQMVKVYDNNLLLRAMICSTGAPGTPTPVGDFRIQGKGPMFVTDYGVSAKYYSAFNGDYLFHSILFDRTGKRLISRSVQMLGRPASHGCIRLNLYDAKWLQEKVPRGTPVKIRKSGRAGMKKEKVKVQVNGKLYPAWLDVRWLEGQAYLRAQQLSWFIPGKMIIKGTYIQFVREKTVLELFLSEPGLKINGRETRSCLAPQLFADGPYLPLQPVLSALGYQLEYMNKAKVIKIQTVIQLPQPNGTENVADGVYGNIYN
ncbi:L,D-transpeptidase [Carboxydocella sp. ULO1]|uniref:L,D-transpeptidase n=1 Tax=Carboxydocella sp. ULO1 TaxID=1926599 RepID=UPI0013565672|nr:L,D-transpeptidase [Carboxydocella sp. ULO1]